MRNLSQKHPVVTFLLLTFGWTWLFWLAAVPFRGQGLLVTALVTLGGFGPALAGVLTLALRSGARPRLTARRALAWALFSLLIFGLLALRYRVGNVPDYDTLAADLTLTPAIILAALVASLAGGWALSAAVSALPDVRARMVSLLPWRSPAGWTIAAVLFYPLLILAGWGLAAVLGLDVEYPGLWDRPLAQSLPLYALTFALVALAQGGNEEPGWRGFLQPELQKRFSPLVAALIVAGAWSLWHLPLYWNGFYAENVVGGMLGGAVFRVLLAVFLAWFYNRSGSLFAMVWLHASFNVMVNFLPTSDLGLLVLWLAAALIAVFADKMYRKPAPNKEQQPPLVAAPAGKSL